MNIFHKMATLTALSENEKTVVAYIQLHPHEVLAMTPSVLAAHCYVSQSTIYRLCQKLDLRGVSELKLLMSTDMASHAKENHQMNYDYPIEEHQSHFEVSQTLKELYGQTILATQNLMDYEALKQAVDYLVKANNIDIYTSAGNVYVAQNFRFQMEEIGIHIHIPVEEYEQRLVAASSDASHVAIVISFGGRGNFVQPVLKCLAANQTPVILITSLDYATIKQDAKVALYMCSYEDHAHKISSYGTRLSLLYILDCLYTCYFQRDYECNKRKKISFYECMKKHA